MPIAHIAKPVDGSKRQLAQLFGEKWHALTAAFLGEAFDAMDASLYFVAMYPAVSELLRSKNDIEIGQTGSYILATFMLGWFFGAILFGMLADKIGRRKTMITTILIYSIATAFCSLAQNWVQLALCRLVVGAGIGGEIILGTVVIAEFWKGRARLWASCVLESSFYVGVMASAGINSALGAYGWRWLFVAGVIPALFTVYIRSKLNESAAFEQVKRHRSLLSTNSNAINESDRHLLRPPMVQLMDNSLRPTLITVSMLGISAIIGYWACMAWIPAWINQMFGGALAVNERSTAMSILSAGGIAGCFITPLLIDRLGRRGTFILSFAGALICSLCMFLSVHSYGIPLLCWSFALGCLASVQFTAMQIYIPEVFPTSALATATGICFGAARIFCCGLTLFGAQLIAWYGGSYALAAGTLSTIYILGTLAAFRVFETNGEAAGTMLSRPKEPTIPEPTGRKVGHSKAKAPTF